MLQSHISSSSRGTRLAKAGMRSRKNVCTRATVNAAVLSEMKTSVDQLKQIAESIGVRWGTVEKNHVTIYFGEGAYRETLKNLAIFLPQWKQRSDEGDRSWYEWNEAIFTNKTDEYMEKHYPNREEIGDTLRALLKIYSEAEIVDLLNHKVLAA